MCGVGGPLSGAETLWRFAACGSHNALHAHYAANLQSVSAEPQEAPKFADAPTARFAKITKKCALFNFLKFPIKRPNYSTIDVGTTLQNTPESKRLHPASHNYSPLTAQISILTPFDPCNIGITRSKITLPQYISEHLGEL